jgi:ATP-dependent exoDNAse (exonuclease V) beta subunit
LKTGLLTKIVKENTTGKTKEKDSLDISKFYVALTRARYSVAIVYDYSDDSFIEGVCKYFLD